MHDTFSLESRKRDMLQRIADLGASGTGTNDIFANRAIARLLVGGDSVAANLQLRRTAAWFDHAHPHGRDLRGEPDFAAINLSFALWRLDGTDVLDSESVVAIRRFFLTTDFQSVYHSENHHLLFRASRYLAAMRWEDERFDAWGKLGSDLAATDAEWLKRFLRYRAGYGWAEFDSACYLLPDFEALLSIHEYAEDHELHEISEMSLNLLLADMAVDSVNGCPGGAQGRIYPGNATDHTSSPGYAIQRLYFGIANVTDPAGAACSVQLAATTFRPEALVVRMATERATPYVNRERRHLHNMDDVLPEKPLTESLRKITAWTPDYVLGCVQHQDAYPPCVSDFAAGYAFHQQHDWDLTFASSPHARLFSHHPGTSDQHNDWTGDHDCGCGRFFQSGSTLLAFYCIPDHASLKFIHAFVPRAAFDEVVEEAGWIFVRAGSGYGALWMSPGYAWGTEGDWAHREIRTPDSSGTVGVVCVAGRGAQDGSFDEFRAAVLARPLAFDRDAITLGQVALSYRGDRTVAGLAEPLDYQAHDSPYVRGAWGGKRVTLSFCGQSKVLDFS